MIQKLLISKNLDYLYASSVEYFLVVNYTQVNTRDKISINDIH